MRTDTASRIDVQILKSQLHSGDPIALIDVREPGEAGEGRPLLAVNLPYSRLEADAPGLLPCLTLPIVLMDDGGQDDRALRSAGRLAAIGYEVLSVMDGGLAAWSAAGFSVYKGVNVPSKTFGELLEHAHDTPAIDAADLEAMRHSDAPPLILDGRTPAEFARMSIPDAISCPNGELALRAAAMAKPDQTIVVNCAGRTRSIVGAQTLIDFGVPHDVVALRNGTMGWYLSGFELDHGETRSFPDSVPDDVLAMARARAADLAVEAAIGFVSAGEVHAWQRDPDGCVYVLDVRTHAEFSADPHPGAVHAPGGQLVQTTDHWIAARGARVVLIDGEGVRAVMAGRWLKQMGHDVYVLKPGERLGAPPALVGASSSIVPLDELDAGALRAAIESGAHAVDLRASAAFADAHVAGARWSIRPRLEALGLTDHVVLIADDAETAALAALDLNELGLTVAGVHIGRPESWRQAGLEVVENDAVPDAERIDFLFFVHDRHQGNAQAARDYLEWEIGLVGQLDADEQALFGLAHHA